MIGSQIAGLGTAVPDRVLGNEELAPTLGITPEWIVERTGIEQRYVAADDDTASSLGARAAMYALRAAEIKAADVDLVICATVTGDLQFPSTACLIQDAIGARAGAFDLAAGCSGFLYALAQADAAIRSGTAQIVLVVGSEVLSRITDHRDAKTAVLFGDGAGAAVVERTDGATRVGPFSLGSDGSRPELLYVDTGSGLIQMQGREVYRAAVDKMTSSVVELLSDCGMSIRDVDLLVAHQANQRILDAVAARAGIPREKVISNIARYGNTSAASIPIALSEAQSSGLLNDGDLVVLTAFGAGFTWGAGLVRWGTNARTDSERVGAGMADA